MPSCLSSIDGPMSIPASSPFPTLSALVFSTSAAVNRSTIGSSTMTRDVAVQLLSRREEGGVHDDVHGVRDVRVGEHDRRILPTHLELHARAALCRLDRDLTARPFRARERDRLHVGVRDDLVPDLRPGTGDEVERSLRDTRFAERFDQTQRTERRQIRRLQHDSVAGRSAPAPPSTSGSRSGSSTA